MLIFPSKNKISGPHSIKGQKSKEWLQEGSLPTEEKEGEEETALCHVE